MAKYKIENDNCLGITCEGRSVYVESEGYVELSDEEVSTIIDLIRKEGSTYISEIGLKEKYPDIYDKLDKAYHDMAYNVEELHWLWEGYDNGYYEYDTQELMSYCEEKCGFKFNNIEDGILNVGTLGYDKVDAFYDWLDDYINSLDDEDVKDFFYNHMNTDLNMEGVEYEVVIPKEIVDMATNH